MAVSKPKESDESRKARERDRQIADAEQRKAAQTEAGSLTRDLQRAFGGLNVFGVRK